MVPMSERPMTLREVADAEDPPPTPAEVYRRLRPYTGPSPARALAAYHALVTRQAMPPTPSEESRWLEAGAPEDQV